MRDRILRPIGIRGSYNLQDISEAEFINIAVLYDSGRIAAENFKGVKPPGRDLSKYINGTNGFLFSPQGGLRVTAKELGRIAQVIMNQGTYGYV